jgi:hypothetical protein
VARPGQVVEIAAGRYGAQQIARDPSKTSSQRVVFRPARGARVELAGKLSLGNGLGTPAPSNLTLQGIRVSGTELGIFSPARNITLIGVSAANFYIRGVQNVVIRGGRWGPCRVPNDDVCSNSKIDWPSGSEQPNDRITVESATFHDYRITPGSGAHFECMYISGGTNITIRNSKFSDCEFFDIFVTNIPSKVGSHSGLMVENNWFDTPWDGQGRKNRGSAVAFKANGAPDPAFSDVVVRRNSFATGFSADNDGRGQFARFRVVGNILTSSYGCDDSVTLYAVNVWTGRRCGATDRGVPFGYRFAAGMLRLDGKRAQAVRRLFREGSKGRTAGTVARILAAGQFPSPGGGWSAELVRGVGADRAYLGNRYGSRGAHPALTSRRGWDRAQRAFKS